ncbi:EthD family reductase [uncultured Amphritea sp.]|uniref:EthD family reductase n=1 Tax=uncultured Amphritea sp. TaxID=981605 RepID=UPI0026269840|nr:EthD family reductase [uncultured Amphritea sp.]
MIKVSVMYPNSVGVTFDIDYYCHTHFPLVATLLGDALKSVAVEYGLTGATPEEEPAFIAMGHMTFDSVEAFKTAYGLNIVEIKADIPNFTNVKSVIQISEIKI